MSVRPYTEADFPAVCSIYREAKRDELAFEGAHFKVTPLEQDTPILAAFRESRVLVFDSGDVLGFAAVFGGQLRALFVRGSARGKGVGAALMGEVLADLPEGIALNVAKSNLRARKFYHALGFSAVRESVRPYDGKDVAYLEMTCKSGVSSDIRTRTHKP